MESLLKKFPLHISSCSKSLGTTLQCVVVASSCNFSICCLIVIRRRLALCCCSIHNLSRSSLGLKKRVYVYSLCTGSYSRRDDLAPSPPPAAPASSTSARQPPDIFLGQPPRQENRRPPGRFFLGFGRFFFLKCWEIIC